MLDLIIGSNYAVKTISTEVLPSVLDNVQYLGTMGTTVVLGMGINVIDVNNSLQNELNIRFGVDVNDMSFLLFKNNSTKAFTALSTLWISEDGVTAAKDGTLLVTFQAIASTDMENISRLLNNHGYNNFGMQILNV